MPVFLVGPPGAGKSTIGRHLAVLLNAAFVDLDDVVQEVLPLGTTAPNQILKQLCDGFCTRILVALQLIC